jgi:hypothetical protein
MKKKTVRCHDVLGHICEDLDTKLTSAKCRALKSHLEKCPNCTAYLDSLRKTITLYASSPNLRIPEKARKELFAVLKLEHRHTGRRVSAPTKSR